MPSSDVRELWLQGCHKWFLKKDVDKGKYGTSAIVHTGSSPIFVVFSYDYIFGDQKLCSQSGLLMFLQRR